jgi:hypothetical protein
MTLFLASASWADVPAPPVNQDIGMDDVLIGGLTEADCRVCHASGLPDRHHLLYGQPILPGSLVPYPDADGDGNDDTIYGCLNCHDENFTVVRDCAVCHGAGVSPHHTVQTAQDGDCQACHGDLVDNMGDGHYIPTYAPSLVTPVLSGGDGLPLNSRGIGAGACDYCHDDDGLGPQDTVIRTNQVLHHGTGLGTCAWCHGSPTPPDDEKIRTCEGCHGPDSLHNIQADSPKTPTGTLVVGGEDAGYGHVGRDAGPGDSDCWGCHGFDFPAKAASEGFWSGPIIPTISSSEYAAINAGTDTAVILTGSAFTNIAGKNLYESDVALTAADGSFVILTPDSIDQGELTFTIPGDTAHGNYNLQAVKDSFASNPAVISITPEVIITDATCDGTVTINGSGFAGYAEGSGTLVTGTIKTGTVEATIISWDDTLIEADFDSCPDEVTVDAVFGTSTSEVGGDGGGGDGGGCFIATIF